jgi:hypothetical protein
MSKDKMNTRTQTAENYGKNSLNETLQINIRNIKNNLI